MRFIYLILKVGVNEILVWYRISFGKSCICEIFRGLFFLEEYVYCIYNIFWYIVFICDYFFNIIEVIVVVVFFFFNVDCVV